MIRLLPPTAALLLAGCAANIPPDDHAEHERVVQATSSTQMVATPTTGQGTIPPGAAEAQARLAASSRHGEWVVVRSSASDSVRAWVVYPERRERAPVVVVVHEIFGVSHWMRAVADQLAADGFIAVAPDLLTMKDLPTGADGAPDGDAARAAIRTLEPAAVHRDILAVANYAMALPAATQKYGIVGFCWGGSTSFEHAVRSPEVDAAVVYYGTSPATESLAQVRAPVLGLYGEDDARVNATIAPAQAEMQRLGKPYEPHTFEAAGHGFLRQQDGREGANLRASMAAWPLTVAWFRRHLAG